MIENPDPDGFEGFFERATGFKPYPYQIRLAEGDALPSLINIPTGAGKTAAAVLAWLWRRRFADKASRNATPRRLVYCLPMRVLVEQTRDNAILWLHRLGLIGSEAVFEGEREKERVKDYKPSWKEPEKIAVTVLMGGEDADEWDLYPERDAIIIGTQDMLLSRALNRGYGMSRYRWPMHFGLLNNDCLWVMDEVQLMGSGLATGAQMAAFRIQVGTMEPTIERTLWMSATLNREWLRTVDFDPTKNISSILTLEQKDLADERIKTRIRAPKRLKKCVCAPKEPKKLAEEVLEKHHQGTRTLVVINTVRRAMDIYSALKTALKRNGTTPELVLIHSRFRPLDRKKRVGSLLAEPGPAGTIIVSTQVIEAGVDVSARTLFTELAPWSSLVQRFGRCNRYGEYGESEVFWIDLHTGDKSQALPYNDDELDVARKQLETLEGKSVSPELLPKLETPIKIKQVIRKKDIIELLDTTPDLTGQDIDISRFIRESSDTDVQVFWRELPDDKPGDEEPRPQRDELCPVPIEEIRNLAEKTLAAWYWDPLEGIWSPIRATTIFPTIIIMLKASEGRYSPEDGWNVKSKAPVPIIFPGKKHPEENYGDNEKSQGTWKSIAEHTDEVLKTMSHFINVLGLPDKWKAALLEGVRWHDAGKAHSAFRAMIKPEELERFSNHLVAKAPRNAWRVGKVTDGSDGRRKFFRHELASGVLALQNGKSDLVAYLAASHHGKVRLSIRSMPDEFLPPDNRRFARGVWDEDKLPRIDLGGGIRIPEASIDLSYMELGEGAHGPSWLARMLALRDGTDLGIFRLSFLEALVKAADERASGGKP